LVALQFEGTFGVDGILTNDNLFEAIFGAGSKSQVDTDGDTVADTNVYTPQYEPKSFTLQYGFMGNKRILKTLVGCLIRNVSLSARVREPIRYRISCVYKRPGKENPTTDIEPVDPDEVAIPTFIEADLTFMGQTFLVQSFSVSMDLGNNLLYALGSAFPQDMYRGRLAVNGNLTVLAQSDEIIDLAYSLGWSSSGVSQPVDSSVVNENQSAVLTLRLDDDSDGVAEREFEIEVRGIAINRLSQDLEAGELVLYSVDFVALLANAKYKFG
jgi:hypothetical protein